MKPTNLITNAIVEKIKFVGFIIGEQLKDFLVGLFTGGAGLASKIGTLLTDVVDKVKGASKLATKGFNALEALVGQSITLAGDIVAKIKPGGKIGGDARLL